MSSWMRVAGSWRFAAVTTLAVPLLPHIPLLLGRVSPVWDALNLFGPYFMLVGDFARHGQFLLWNPFLNGGSPDYIEPEFGAFSPLLTLVALVSGGSPHGFELYWLAVWVIGPLGVLVLARHLGAPAWGGMVSALGLAFCGFYTGHAENTTCTETLSFLPWVVWRLDVAMQSRRYRAAAEAGAFWGLSALAGYPGLVLLNWCFTALWGVGRVVWPDGNGTAPVASRYASVRRLIVTHALMLAVGFVVLSPAYVPFFVEGPGYSHRAGTLPRSEVVEFNALHPAGVVTMASPALGLVDMFGYTDIALRSVYVGTLVPILAAFALIGRRRGFRWWLLAVAVGFLLAAMGRALPVRGWLYDWFPPTRYFKHAALFRSYFTIAATLLSILGARDLAEALRTESRDQWRHFVMIVGGVVSAALAVFVVTLGVLNVRGIAGVRPIAQAHAWLTWLAPAVLAAAAARAGWTRRALAVPVAFIALAVLEAFGTAVIVRPTMYGQSAAWRAVPGEHRTSLSMTAIGLTRLPENGGDLTFVSKTPAMRGYNQLAGPLFEDYGRNSVLLSSATGTDRLWFSESIVRAARSRECFEAFEARATRLGAPPLVIHSPEVMQSSARAATTGPSIACGPELDAAPAAQRLASNAVRVLAYEPARLSLTVDVPGPGWLLVTDSWSYGWSASVNNRPTPVSGGNFLFRAVPVEAGPNRVDFRFDAVGFPWLVMLSWLVLGVVAASSIRAVLF